MSKVHRLISISIEADTKLSLEENASSLLEYLYLEYKKKKDNPINPIEMEIKISKDIEVLRNQIAKAEESRNAALKEIESRRLIELEKEREFDKEQKANRKIAEIKQQARKEFEKLTKGRNPKAGEWDDFLEDYIKKYKEVEK